MMTKKRIRTIAAICWALYGTFLIALTAFARRISEVVAVPAPDIQTAAFIFKLYLIVSTVSAAIVTALQFLILKSKASRERLERMSVLRYGMTSVILLAVSCLMAFVPWSYGITFGLADRLDYAWPFFVIAGLMLAVAWPSRVEIARPTET